MDVATRKNALDIRDLTKLLWACVGLLASGCASNKDAVIPQNGPPMAEIYQKHMAGLDGASPRLARERLPLRPPEDVNHTEYTRTARDEINNRFGRVPNPDLVMFIFPHLAGAGQYPVPAYSTVFSMYDTVHYAMPGEVAPRETMMPSRQAATDNRPAVQRPLSLEPRATQALTPPPAIPAVIPVGVETTSGSTTTQ